MEVFIALCVLIAVIIGVVIGTLLIGFLMAWAGGDKEDSIWFAWLLSSAGLVYCIVRLLSEHGVFE